MTAATDSTSTTAFGFGTRSGIQRVATFTLLSRFFPLRTFLSAVTSVGPTGYAASGRRTGHDKLVADRTPRKYTTTAWGRSG